MSRLWRCGTTTVRLESTLSSKNTFSSGGGNRSIFRIAEDRVVALLAATGFVGRFVVRVRRVASGGGRWSAVRIGQFPDSVLSKLAGPLSQPWNLSYGWRPEFRAGSWESPRRISALLVSRKTAVGF